MTDMIDLGAAAAQVRQIADGIDDDQLDGPTPCAGTSVAGLLGHVLGLSVAFRRAAEKAPDDGTRPGGTASLPDGWRARLPRELDALVRAWRDPAAWDGETSAGGVTSPAAQMGVVALDELVLHGWDLAVATGQDFQVAPEDLDVVLDFTTATADAPPEARDGLFGPVVDVGDDASALDRALGLAGRDPAWHPSRGGGRSRSASAGR